jgi:hypothetical protein
MTIAADPRRLSAVFADEHALRGALERLRREAPGCRVVELRSSIPLPDDLAAQAPSRRSRAPLLGIAGGALGGVAGWLLALFTARAYPLVTGHMPIVAGPPTGIVVYEGIALGAVLATTLAVVIEGGLARRRRAGPEDAAVAAGGIAVTLEAPPSGPESDRARAVLADSGGVA